MNARLVEHFMNPRNVGVMQSADLCVEIRNGSCGDLGTLYLSIADDRSVRNVQYLAYGCSTSLAVTSLLSELLSGKTQAQLVALDQAQLAGVLGPLAPREQHCLAHASEIIAAVGEGLRSGKAERREPTACRSQVMEPPARNQRAAVMIDGSAAARVVAMCAAHLKIAEACIRPESLLVEDLGIDSMLAATLFSTLEEEFNVEILDRDAAQVRTIADVVALVSAP